MRDAESVPKNNVGILNGSVAIRNPFRYAAGGLSRGLWDMPACWIQLVVRICASIS
jgi:hypothetical protein